MWGLPPARAAPENVVVSSGCGAILSNMMLALFEPGKTALLQAAGVGDAVEALRERGQSDEAQEFAQGIARALSTGEVPHPVVESEDSWIML